MRIIPIGQTILTLSLITACGNNSFLGASSTKNAPPAPQGGDPLDPNVVGPSSVEGGDVELAAPTEKEKDAIGNCSKAWGMTPPTSFEVVRKIMASVSIGSKGVTLQDKARTNAPSLTLLYAGVNVGGAPIWELTNPNGWYCIVVTVNVVTDLTVRLAQEAHLADSKVAVNVGSKTDGSISAIGVNVGSNIKVERQ